MIIELLEFYLKYNKLYNSWLIEAWNIEQTLQDLKEFIYIKFFNSNIPLENNPDYYFVARKDSYTSNAKNISIEQIRKLQDFLNKTSAISGYKVAVIYSADLMNLHAANACLKILEDTPKNSYIFLITSRAASIISTIRSRCFKVNIRSPLPNVSNDLYLQFIQPIADNKTLDFINRFTTKDRELWLGFIENLFLLMNRILKKSVNFNIDLLDLENKIFNKLNKNPAYLLQKFTDIKKLIYNTIDYDLDLKTSYILVVNEFFTV
ncbi:DNA polymerase III subunit delta' [Rickettsia prowazekii str. GvV257]|uniref:DNA polymerase III subunit delta' n=1 Tax=Rickettsia prowazekii TaxID=782 RepID=UPI000256C577|nr:DNA polymerase III subunit delta' [Rickettsia prowazekii]AFE52619.1 DNA polymerase III subunit delta' [Rickettsia prowazekii str. GvV257]AFE53190.1 DNA polymerase III subunit delta' [Rickettsia prowazekii str. RpGvF24]EOB10684.1 DNA-binding protein HU [Rickettsia prowazekii str. GvF12]